MFSFGFGPNGDHMCPSYLIIRKQQPCYLAPFYLLFNPSSLPSLLLNPTCASKINTHVLTWICLQACLKVLVKSITNLLDSCWSPSCRKLCSSTFFNNYDNCYICYSPQLCYSFGSFILFFFSFSFYDFFYSCHVHLFFPWNVYIFNESHNM
jgi:hypothetical protein